MMQAADTVPQFGISIGIGHGVRVTPGSSLLSVTRRSSPFPGTHLYTTQAWPFHVSIYGNNY